MRFKECKSCKRMKMMIDFIDEETKLIYYKCSVCRISLPVKVGIRSAIVAEKKVCKECEIEKMIGSTFMDERGTEHEICGRCRSHERLGIDGSEYVAMLEEAAGDSKYSGQQSNYGTQLRIVV
jgi:hypothetical protein